MEHFASQPIPPPPSSSSEDDADDDETFEGDPKDDGYYKILDNDPAIHMSQFEECKRMMRNRYNTKIKKNG